MAVGKNDGIRPADVVGSIANEANIPGREIGPIDIRDDVTYVSIPSRYLEDVLAKLARARFRGRPVNLKVATGADEPRERPRYGGPPGKRFVRDDRKPFRPDDRPRGDKPFDREARPFAKKPFTKKPFEKKPFEKKPFEKKPFGKPFASKGKPRKPPR